MKYEIRSGNPAEVRESDDGTIKVSGYAAVFDEETEIAGVYREVIKKGAFTEAVKRDDVIFNVNHDGLPLARTRSKTLTIKEDDHGLFMETHLDATDPDVQQIVPKMKRGDLDKMSFAFFVESRQWDEEDEDKLPLRTILKASLVDVSIVNFPAYEGTEIGLRSDRDKASAIKCLEEYRSEKNTNHAAVRARMKMNLSLRRIDGHPAR